jgi:hypothetical protein
VTWGHHTHPHYYLQIMDYYFIAYEVLSIACKKYILSGSICVIL